MSEETLNNLFAQARDEAPETTKSDILKWISGGTLLMILAAQLAKFKILFISKPLVMISSIITVAGISIATLAVLPAKPVKSNPEAVKAFFEPEKTAAVVTDSLKTETDHNAAISFLPKEKTVVTLPFLGADLNSPAQRLLETPVVKPVPVTKEFHTINLIGMTDIQLVQRDTFGIYVTADYDGNIPDCYDIKDGVLTIGYPLDTTGEAPTETVTAIISMKDLKKIVLEDITNVWSDETLKLTELTIDSDGASDVTLNLNLEKLIVESKGAARMNLNITAENLKMNLLGASTITAKGKAKFLDLNNDEVAEFKANGLKLDRAKIYANGVSECKVHVADFIEVDANGIARVKFSGTPKKGRVSVNEQAKFGRF